MTRASKPPLRVAGDTHVGSVRTENEDSMIVDPARGLYVVLDGMGGANAGDIASQTARDAILSYVAHRLGKQEPPVLLEAAIQSASASVFGAAQAHRERQGMGTTVVACLVVDHTRAIVGHVGDSRAYLLREGRLQALTRDHTIVEELVTRGLLGAEEAERHPYKNVLSRNLGARAETRVDVVEVELRPGDRLMLCSDGLYGYAATEAIQYLLGSGDAPEHVARDLIELALRGGGGDNVTVIVLEAPPEAASSTELVKTNGAMAWWQRRQRFLHVAQERGLTRNAMVRGLEPAEAVELVGLSLCQAIFHDLEKSTGVNVWTFAQNLAGGWFERGGDWAPLREMMDLLGESARFVVDELRTIEPQLGFLLDVAVSRALVVAELALGGLLADRLRLVDGELIALHTANQETIDGEADDLDTTGDRFIDRPTIPFLRDERTVTNTSEPAEVIEAIEKALTIARGRTAPRAELVRQVLTSLETIACEGAGAFATAVLAARDLYGVRTVDDQGIMPMFDAFDQARIITAASVQQIQANDATKARALRAISAAHQRLVGAATGLVLEAVMPFSDKLRDAQAVTGELRDQVERAERRRANLEREHATNADPSLPWGSRGTTEWGESMSETDLVEAVSVLRDEVLDTVEHGDRDPPGTEVFDALVRALVIGGESVPGLDLTLHDSVARRLAWGDSEEVVLADAEVVFDRLMVAVERAFRDPLDRMVVIEAATQVAVTVARVVSLAAVARAARDRAARLREEMTQRQLREVLDKQKTTLSKLERDF